LGWAIRSEEAVLKDAGTLLALSPTDREAWDAFVAGRSPSPRHASDHREPSVRR
jgi:hypothetical protein